MPLKLLQTTHPPCDSMASFNNSVSSLTKSTMKKVKSENETKKSIKL
jgi:hypothetical protein